MTEANYGRSAGSAGDAPNWWTWPPAPQPASRPPAAKDGLLALADDAQDAVAVFLAEVGDVGAGGFEDAQAEQAEKTDQREVGPVR